MRYKEIPSLNHLNECFDADFENGLLFWKIRPINHFRDQRIYHSWNRRFPKTKAGAFNNVSKYIIVKLDKVDYVIHRILWKMYYGEINSRLDIDHIDGNKTNNKISNLRLVERFVNTRNQKLRNINTSGYKGIHFDNKRLKWMVQISFNGRQEYLGSFENKEDAIICRKKAEKENGYLNTH